MLGLDGKVCTSRARRVADLGKSSPIATSVATSSKRSPSWPACGNAFRSDFGQSRDPRRVQRIKRLMIGHRLRERLAVQYQQTAPGLLGERLVVDAPIPGTP